MSAYRKFLPEHDKWLAENYPDMGAMNAARELEKIFGLKTTKDSVRTHCRKIGICCSEKRISTVRRENRTNTKELYSVRTRKRGEKEIKVGSNDWIPLSRYTYEQHYGKIPEGYCIILLDGNKSNCNIENLMAVPKEYVTILQRKNLRSEFPEVTKAGVRWCELYSALKDSGFDFKGYERQIKPRDPYDHKIFNSNSSGFTGVSWRKDREKWRAFIVIGDKTKHLGYFTKIEDAVDARLKAEMELKLNK